MDMREVTVNARGPECKLGCKPEHGRTERKARTKFGSKEVVVIGLIP